MNKIKTHLFALTVIAFLGFSAFSQKPKKKQDNKRPEKPTQMTICDGTNFPEGYVIISQTIDLNCMKQNQTGKSFVLQLRDSRMPTDDQKQVSHSEPANSFASALQKDKIENGWRGILPIKSNQADVEKTLGSPKKVLANGSFYETEDAVINMVYTSEPCSGKGFGIYNVPSQTVLFFSVQPKTDLLISGIIWDKDKYQKDGSAIGDGKTLYFNLNEHISIATKTLGKNQEQITSLWYNPAERYQNLKCN